MKTRSESQLTTKTNRCHRIKQNQRHFYRLVSWRGSRQQPRCELPNFWNRFLSQDHRFSARTKDITTFLTRRVSYIWDGDEVCSACSRTSRSSTKSAWMLQNFNSTFQDLLPLSKHFLYQMDTWETSHRPRVFLLLVNSAANITLSMSKYKNLQWFNNNVFCFSKIRFSCQLFKRENTFCYILTHTSTHVFIYYVFKMTH